MTFLLCMFTFTTAIYLMNLFIGLLNMVIANYNKDEEFLLLKARVFYFNDLLIFFILNFNYNFISKDYYGNYVILYATLSKT